MRCLVFLSALCVALVACDKAEDGDGLGTGTANARAFSLFDPVAATASLCGGPAIPFPNNALFAVTDGSSPTGLTTDTTLNIPSTASTAVAANLTDGYSTTASAFTDFLGPIDYSTAAGSVIVLEADASPRILVQGTDYEIQPSIAMAQVSGTGGACLANVGAATFMPINQQFRSRILIEPKKPLNPSTTYIVVVTKGLLSTGGEPAAPAAMFGVVNRDARICRLPTDSSGTEILCTDSNAPATLAATISPMLANLGAPPTTPAQKLITLETLRRNLVRPTVLGFQQLHNVVLAQPAITDDDLVVAWSFTTQSIGATLQTLNAIATAKTFAVANTGLSTGDLGLGLADTADIFAGTLNAVPYYLDDASGVNDATSQCLGAVVPGVSCNAFWANNGAVTSAGAGGFVPWTPLGDYDGNAGTPPTPAPCTTGVPPFNWVAPLSTTNCHRIPLERSQENLLVMVTVPNANTGLTKPANGWPVVIFQHGITGNRTQMLALAPTLASVGFVTVSIDLPLHGLVPPGSVATCGSTSNNAFYVAGGIERTFDLDLVNNVSGASGPDGITDCAGTHFINLASLITSRDNLRQAVADQIHLIRSLQATDPMNLDGAAGDDIDETRIHFAGISLGSIVGTTLLGVDTGASAAADGSDEAIIAASLSVPGGGVAKLLDASATFGPRIAAGLAGVAFATNSSGSGSPFEGTDTYETFVRFAQHLLDPGDPINFATSANANHRIHLSEVIGDTVVPNNALSNCPLPDALPPLTFQATSNATAAETRLAACRAGGALAGSNAVTQAACFAGVATAGVCTPSSGKDETLISGFLSGTEPLFGQMGGMAVAGPIDPLTGGCANQTNGAGLDVVVQFATGTHGSLLTPAGPGGATQFLAVTGEMQRETATYFASDGLTLASGSCP
jgi:hypothetical protein